MIKNKKSYEELFKEYNLSPILKKIYKNTNTNETGVPDLHHWQLADKDGQKVSEVYYTHVNANTVHLEKIKVESDFTRKGIGTMLISELLKSSMNMILDVMSPTAEEFYRSMGFSIESISGGSKGMTYDKKEIILKTLSSFEKIEDAKKDILFHGTCEEIKGSLRGGGYDGVLWTAHTPDIAQTYIPTSGISTRYTKPGRLYLDSFVSFTHSMEDSVEISIAKDMGYEFSQVETDDFNKIKSFCLKYKGKYIDPPKA